MNLVGYVLHQVNPSIGPVVSVHTKIHGLKFSTLIVIVTAHLVK
jgi:hypothetical protein